MRIIQTPCRMGSGEGEKLYLSWKEMAAEYGCRMEEICFLDIETTGFSRLYNSIYLIGYTALEKGELITRQILAGGLKEEPELLQSVLRDLRRFRGIVTYNGDMFDLPFIKERARRLHVLSPEEEWWMKGLCSIDLIRRYRPYQTFFGWPDMKLKTVEQYLGASRMDPFDGGQLIEVFAAYEENPDERLEKTLLLHNYEDIVNLLSLLRAERMIRCLRDGKALAASLEGRFLRVQWDRAIPLTMEAALPLEKRKKKDIESDSAPLSCFRFEAESSVFEIGLPVFAQGQEVSLRYYLPKPGDYFFLPQTGEIVHRSLADGIPANMRRKAKAEECFLPAPEGTYLALPKLPEEIPSLPKLLRREAKDPLGFVRAEELGSWLTEASEEEIQIIVSGIVRLIG